MRVAFISDWYSEKMGYAENCLPKSMASLGHDVHVISSNVQTYFNSPTYQETYESFIGPGIVACGIKEINGYTLHRLPHQNWNGDLYIEGLLGKLRSLRPQIIQTFDVFSLTTLEASLAKLLWGYKLFLASHIHASVFPLSKRWDRIGTKRRLKWITKAVVRGRVASFLSEKCYPISTDAAEIVVRFYGVQSHKVKICSLGVDTDLFRPLSDDSSQKARAKIRRQFGISESDILCIYTGRFSQAKDPLCLAQAINFLINKGMPFRGIFIGDGPQKEAIQGCKECYVHPFVPFNKLPQFYWAADICVWPRQESTSQLDAIACGLPIILSNRVEVRERIEGNGLLYEEGDTQDLARKICTLSNMETRRVLGEHGAQKIRKHFSWDIIARQRAVDYEAALRR